MAARCRTLTVICLLGLWSGLIVFSFGLLEAIYFFARSKHQAERSARIIAYLYGRGCMFIVSPWIKVRRENLGLLQIPCIVAANHLSMLDLTCLSFLPERNICIMIKSWPAATPFMGRFVRAAGYINADQLTFTEIRRRVEKEIARKSVIVIFPEGSRSPDGSLKRLRSGAFKLAIATGLPIYPLRYRGTDKALPKGRPMFYPAAITMRLYDKILPPKAELASPDHGAHKRLRQQVRACLQEARPETS
jgi:1-acyl-sn-glycerol-3-phosphate acyltransferase